MDRLLYIFDLDGVIYRGKVPQPFAREALLALRQNGKQIYFLTNNATKSRQEVADKLTAMGVQAAPDEVMTSSHATGLWFQENGHSGKTVMIIGEDGCHRELQEAGMVTTPPVPDTPADFVVVGLDRDFTYQKLFWAQRAILNGATFIATNRDATYPFEDGVMPGGGSLVACVAEAVGHQPLTIGKPETYAVEKILQITGIPKAQSAVVGDRLDTDILLGSRAGIFTYLVLGGVNTEEDVQTAPDDQKPDAIIDNLMGLLETGQ